MDYQGMLTVDFWINKLSILGDFSIFDYFLIAVVIVSVIDACKRGIVDELLNVILVCAPLALTYFCHDNFVTNALKQYFADSEFVPFLYVEYVVTFVLSFIVFHLIIIDMKDRMIKKEDENIISINKMFGAVFGIIRVYVLLFFVMAVYDDFTQFTLVKESLICSRIIQDVGKRFNKPLTENLQKVKNTGLKAVKKAINGDEGGEE